MSIGNKKEALIRAIKNSKCYCDKDSSDEQGGGTINYDELAEKFKNFYIYPKKDKARFFQDGVDGEYDASKGINQKYLNGYIADKVESYIVGTANVEDYFEVSDIEVFKLLATAISHSSNEDIISRNQTDTTKLFVSYSTGSVDGLQATSNPDKGTLDVSIFHIEYGDEDNHPRFRIILTPEDYTKFYILASQLPIA